MQIASTSMNAAAALWRPSIDCAEPGHEERIEERAGGRDRRPLSESGGTVDSERMRLSRAVESGRCARTPRDGSATAPIDGGDDRRRAAVRDRAMIAS